MPDLWHSRCCLGSVEGFDHSLVNRTLGACGLLPPPLEGPLLPYAVWQCGQYKVSLLPFFLLFLSNEKMSTSYCQSPQRNAAGLYPAIFLFPVDSIQAISQIILK
jgi:protein arginine N-methyltransferase 7